MAKIMQLKYVGSISYDRSQFVGNGRFGQVYVGTFDRKKIALKRIQIPSLSDCNISIVRELIRLDPHPNVVPCFALEEDFDFWYLAYEWLDFNLTVFTRDNLATSLGEKSNIAVQLTRGLEFIHGKRWIHTDIKPSNVLLHRNDHSEGRNCWDAKLADTGLSSTQSLTDGQSNRFTSKLDYKALGWLAPELYNPPFQFSEKSDIWALGCVFYYLYSAGQHPFQPPGGSSDYSERVVSIANGKYQLTNLPENNQIKQTIESMIQKEATRRPTLGDIIRQLIHSETRPLVSIEGSFNKCSDCITLGSE